MRTAPFLSSRIMLEWLLAICTIALSPPLYPVSRISSILPLSEQLTANGVTSMYSLMRLCSSCVT